MRSPKAGLPCNPSAVLHSRTVQLFEARQPPTGLESWSPEGCLPRRGGRVQAGVICWGVTERGPSAGRGTGDDNRIEAVVTTHQDWVRRVLTWFSQSL